MSSPNPLPAIGTIGRVVHPAKGDWGEDYRVADYTWDETKERREQRLRVESVRRLVTNHPGSVDGKQAPRSETRDDVAADVCQFLPPEWFQATPAVVDAPPPLPKSK